ncbi:MAG: hypothetical protein R6W92_14015 [Desulfocurvibacter africanus]
MCMRHPFFTLLTVLLCLTTLAFTALAEETALTGKYNVQGWEPDSESSQTADYAGQAVISVMGEIYAFEATIDGNVYQGAGLYDPETKTLGFAFQDASHKETGLTLFKVTSKGLEGRWVYLDSEGKKVGMEIWKKTK